MAIRKSTRRSTRKKYASIETKFSYQSFGCLCFKSLLYSAQFLDSPIQIVIGCLNSPSGGILNSERHLVPDSAVLSRFETLKRRPVDLIANKQSDHYRIIRFKSNFPGVFGIERSKLVVRLFKVFIQFSLSPYIS